MSNKSCDLSKTKLGIYCWGSSLPMLLICVQNILRRILFLFAGNHIKNLLALHILTPLCSWFWSGLKLLSVQIFLPKEEESVCFLCLQIHTLIKENTPVKYCNIYISIKYLIWYTGFFVNLLQFFRFIYFLFTIDHSPFLTGCFASAFYLPHFLLNTSRRIAFIGHFCLSTGHKHTFNTSVISPEVHYFHCNPQTIFLLVATFSFSWCFWF